MCMWFANILVGWEGAGVLTIRIALLLLTIILHYTTSAVVQVVPILWLNGTNKLNQLFRKHRC